MSFVAQLNSSELTRAPVAPRLPAPALAPLKTPTGWGTVYGGVLSRFAIISQRREKWRAAFFFQVKSRGCVSLFEHTHTLSFSSFISPSLPHLFPLSLGPSSSSFLPASQSPFPPCSAAVAVLPGPVGA